MKPFNRPFSLLAPLILASAAFAQPVPVDVATAKAQRLAQGIEAARTFAPGEGNPKPAARARVDKADRVAASAARRPGGIEAARSFKPGEGDPKPVASVKLSRAERTTAQRTNRDQVARLNKAGQLPTYGDNYGGK
ncbi:hypothetical protein QTH87_21675 [Variovorax sp. J22P168]|uniref:hypothetical protein n=1 Tax=Variovorax jilinensis TaxID=3053513 RepID=UPI0025753783|nr:hypothetical protein [Variovorax sp. J22P168]MDM0015069.1 hypothetical protein [Variovorax sp. J22P168]